MLIEYWKEMHERYESWINNFNACPVLRLNINEYDIVQNQSSIEPIVEKVSRFLHHSEKLKRRM